MSIRSPRPPDEPDGSPEDHHGPAHAGSVRFRVPAGVILAKFGLVALLLAVTLAFAVRDQTPVGLVATVAVAAYALRDVLARDRVRADADGLVVVSGYAGHHRLDWPQVQRLAVDSRLRLGARAEMLEVDTGDHLYLFSRYELGSPPEEALATLESLRAGRTEGA